MSIGTEEAIDVSFGNVKGNIVHSKMVAIVLGQMLYRYHSVPPWVCRGTAAEGYPPPNLHFAQMVPPDAEMSLKMC